MRISFLLAVLVVCFCQSANASPVFVFSGQSNMVGASGDVVSDLPAQFHEAPDRVRFHNHWTFYEPTPAWSVGPEWGFAHTIAPYMTGGASLGKSAQGNQAIGYWDPAHSAGQYSKTIAAGTDTAADAGGGTIEAFFWLQGESDSLFEDTANAYASKLTAFIGNVRRDMGVAGLPFFIGVINENLDTPYNATVRLAQETVAASLDNCYLVYFDDLSTRSDGIHYTGESLFTAGQRFAESYVANAMLVATPVPLPGALLLLAGGLAGLWQRRV